MELLNHLVAFREAKTGNHDVHIRRLKREACHEGAKHFDLGLLVVEDLLSDLLELLDDHLALFLKLSYLPCDIAHITIDVLTELVIEGVFNRFIVGVVLSYLLKGLLAVLGLDDALVKHVGY